MDRAESVGLGEALQRLARQPLDRAELVDRMEAVAACPLGHQALDLRLLDAGDLAETEAHRDAHEALRLIRRLERTVPVAAIDIDGAQLDSVLARVAHERRRLIEAHRLA